MADHRDCARICLASCPNPSRPRRRPSSSAVRLLSPFILLPSCKLPRSQTRTIKTSAKQKRALNAVRPFQSAGNLSRTLEIFDMAWAGRSVLRNGEPCHILRNRGNEGLLES
jgi:hypothetical protein